jgi:hypothetical protein
MLINLQKELDELIGKYLVLTEVKYQWQYWESERKNSKSAKEKYINHHNSNVIIDPWEDYINKYLSWSKGERTELTLIEMNIQKYKILEVHIFNEEDEDGIRTPFIIEFKLEGFKNSGHFSINGNETLEILDN